MIEHVNGALAGDEGPLTEDENKKQADSNNVSMEKFLINGEEVGQEDVEFDPAEGPTDTGTVIDGEQEDEMHEPARDQALYGKN